MGTDQEIRDEMLARTTLAAVGTKDATGESSGLERRRTEGDAEAAEAPLKRRFVQEKCEELCCHHVADDHLALAA